MDSPLKVLYMSTFLQPNVFMTLGFIFMGTFFGGSN